MDNMTEKNTQTQKDYESDINQALNLAQKANETADKNPADDFIREAAAASRQSIDRPISAQRAAEQSRSRELGQTRPRRGRKIGARIAIGATIAGGAFLVNVTHDALSEPGFSEQTTTYTVEPGDGVFKAAEQIEGINTVDIRDAVDYIQADPANAEVLKDGLQPNEQLIIPVSVKGFDADANK